jgi:hypothetical protein
MLQEWTQNPSLLQKDQGFKSLERLHDSLLGVLAIMTVLLTDPCIPCICGNAERHWQDTSHGSKTLSAAGGAVQHCKHLVVGGEVPGVKCPEWAGWTVCGRPAWAFLTG